MGRPPVSQGDPTPVFLPAIAGLIPVRITAVLAFLDGNRLPPGIKPTIPSNNLINLLDFMIFIYIF